MRLSGSFKKEEEKKREKKRNFCSIASKEDAASTPVSSGGERKKKKENVKSLAETANWQGEKRGREITYFNIKEADDSIFRQSKLGKAFKKSAGKDSLFLFWKKIRDDRRTRRKKRGAHFNFPWPKDAKEKWGKTVKSSIE